ncbi:MAG: lysozyme inhibitor LprI family protein [Bernardetiaceae bacterium]
MKRISLIFLCTALFCQSHLFAQKADGDDYVEFEFKKLHEFKTLDEFESSEAFDEYIENYQSDCIDQRFSVHCFVRITLWQREVDTYYTLLRQLLSGEERRLLEVSQQDWNKARDSMMKFQAASRSKYDFEGSAHMVPNEVNAWG